MARMATRIASGLAAAGIATIVSTAPAQARALPDPQVGCTGTGCTYAAPGPTTSDASPWLKIGLGAAGGVALVGAAVTTVSSRRSHQQHARTHRSPIAG